MDRSSQPADDLRVKLCTVCGVVTSRAGSRCNTHARQSYLGGRGRPRRWCDAHHPRPLRLRPRAPDGADPARRPSSRTRVEIPPRDLAQVHPCEPTSGPAAAMTQPAATRSTQRSRAPGWRPGPEAALEAGKLPGSSPGSGRARQRPASPEPARAKPFALRHGDDHVAALVPAVDVLAGRVVRRAFGCTSSAGRDDGGGVPLRR